MKKERKFKANVKLNFDLGRVRPNVGDEFYLSPEDADIDSLLRLGAMTEIKPKKKEARDGESSS